MNQLSIPIILGEAAIKPVLIFVAIGIVAGLLARAILPGEQKMNIFMTMLLGLAGALIGGFVTSKLGIGGGGLIFSIVSATIGAFLLLILVEVIRKAMRKG